MDQLVVTQPRATPKFIIIVDLTKSTFYSKVIFFGLRLQKLNQNGHVLFRRAPTKKVRRFFRLWRWISAAGAGACFNFGSRGLGFVRLASPTWSWISQL